MTADITPESLEYTPTTEEVRSEWVQLRADGYALVVDDADSLAASELDRWLTAHDAEVARKALLDWIAMQERLLVNFDYALEEGDEAETKQWCKAVLAYADATFPAPEQIGENRG